ncbi:MAG: RsmG family class I SAM-dependent methyltransferase [Acidimicrobiia bacterium]
MKPAESTASWAGIELSDAQRTQLEMYAAWLVDEAIPAGGLGPREANRIWGRHIADSLAFAAAWRGEEPPHEVLDIGSGVGLPGLPLAIAWPECRFTLLDRAGRRTRLMLRAIRALGLENAVVAQGDAFDVADEWHAVVARGAVSAPEFVGLSSKLIDDIGVSVLGLSRRAERPERADDLINVAAGLGLDAELVEIPESALDAVAWLLIMRRSG